DRARRSARLERPAAAVQPGRDAARPVRRADPAIRDGRAARGAAPPGHADARLAMRLRDKVVVVTGAAAGIGLAYARRFLAEGARVVLADVVDPTAALEALARARHRPPRGSRMRRRAAGALRPHRRARQQRGHLREPEATALRRDPGRGVG